MLFRDIQPLMALLSGRQSGPLRLIPCCLGIYEEIVPFVHRSLWKRLWKEKTVIFSYLFFLKKMLIQANETSLEK